MPRKRKLKYVPPIASTTPPNSSNRSPSLHGQGQQSNPPPVSTPSTAHSGVNMTAQSTPDQEASSGPLRKKMRGLSHGLTSQKIMDRNKQKLIKRSAAAKCNRAKMPYDHHGGTRSFNPTREALKEMVELQRSQLKLEDDASIMDETTCAQVLGRSVGTISGSGHAPRKSYMNTSKTPLKFMEQLEILTRKDKETDNVLRELTQRLEQQALLIQSLVTRMDMSQHSSTIPTNDLPPPPPPPPSVGTVVL